MIAEKKDYFPELEKVASNEKKIVREILSLTRVLGEKSSQEKEMVFRQLSSLKNAIRKENEKIFIFLEKISVALPMSKRKAVIFQDKMEDGKDFSKNQIKNENLIENFLHGGLHSYKKIKLNKFEKETLKRLKKKEGEIIKKKEKKPNYYISLSNKFLSDFSARLIERGMFKRISINLIKSNMKFLPKSYVSVILFTTIVSSIFSVFLYTFFIFFSLQVSLPFLVLKQGAILYRIVSVLWILFVIPTITFLFMYMYPTLEKGSIERKINQELPFATINMAAISSSMVDPTKLFEIIVSTREYPALEKEFGKIINGVNILGYDLISVLRNSAITTPSKNLADLFNGIATTINTGGDLPKFFDERAKSLLFKYNLEKEKSNKAAETFMDIYISVVIAAPMILMLLLIIMQVSGLGFSLTTTMITLIMVLGVSLINVVFLTFLYMKQSSEA